MNVSKDKFIGSLTSTSKPPSSPSRMSTSNLNLRSKKFKPHIDAQASRAALFLSWKKQWLERQECQYDFMSKMAPYLFLAKAVSEQEKFFEKFFEVWFDRWPIAESAEKTGTISSVEELTKMVKKNAISDFVYILANINPELIPKDNWISGFQDSTGHGMDVDDDDDMIYVSSQDL